MLFLNFFQCSCGGCSSLANVGIEPATLVMSTALLTEPTGHPFIFLSLFCVVKIRWFCCHISQFTDSFLSPPFYCWAHLLSYFIVFVSSKMSVYLFTFSISLRLSIFAEAIHFLMFQVFIIVHWNIFIMVAVMVSLLCLFDWPKSISR